MYMKYSIINHIQYNDKDIKDKYINLFFNKLSMYIKFVNYLQNILR